MSASGSDRCVVASHEAHSAQLPHGQRKPDVAILPGSVNLASPVRTGDPMLQITGDLEHPEPGAENVDGEPDLDTPTAGQR